MAQASSPLSRRRWPGSERIDRSAVPDACFGLLSVSVDAPNLVDQKDDKRIIKEKVRGRLGNRSERNGVEVKVTRASRDRGVDAIMLDPDPLCGGKYVLKAKRYTRPVDVAAVRDLYGTVVNEGPNRGILVTTSPDAYDFAKDKPLSLVDGPNLIAMLQKHRRRYRIDLAEARRLAALNDTASD